MKRLIPVLLIVGLLCVSSYAFACGACSACALREAQEEATEGVFKGKVICLGCSLKKEKGAAAQCSIYGHKNALQTEDNEVWSFLENDASKDLINSHDYVGKQIEIKGKKYPHAHIIEAEEFNTIE